MIRPRHRLLLGACLLATAGFALLILFSGTHESAGSGTDSGARPRIYFDNEPGVVAYQLQRLSNEQLAEVERDAGHPRYRPVYEALIAREGLASKYRREAILALADLNGSDVISEILAGAERVGETSSKLQRELRNMLLQHNPSELVNARRQLEQTLAASAVSEARVTSYAALVACVPPDDVWWIASGRQRGFIDLLRAIQAVPDERRRDAFYPMIEPLLHKKDSPEIRRAAIETLPSFTAQAKQAFETLAGFIRGGVEQPIAIQSILRIGQEHWLNTEFAPLAEAVVAFVLDLPAQERTGTAFLDAVRLGNELASKLDADASGRIRGILDGLGVTVVQLRTLIDRTSYDKRRIVVETGKRVEIVLENQDFMPHNLVISVPGAREEIGMAIDRMARPDRRDPEGRHYVPPSPKVLHATRLLEPGQTERLSFEAPTVSGDYPYFCTFNGHWRRMFGYLVVVEDMEEYLKNPSSLENLDFTEWELSDLVDDMADIDASRSVAGQEVFETATCVKCHRIGDWGRDFCPDLSDVFQRYDDNSRHVLEEILDPSKSIEEEYMNYLFVLTNGDVATGIITAEGTHSLTVQSSGDESLAVTIDKSDIIERDQRAVSVMPVGLLDTLRRDQIVDLMAFLKYGRAVAAPVSARWQARHATSR